MNQIDNIRIFTAEEVAANGGRPDYIFSDDENTALLWPERREGFDPSFRMIQHSADSPELFECRIYADMPASADELNEILFDTEDAPIDTYVREEDEED